MGKPIQRANGKWQMKIRRKGQKALSETFQTQEDAYKWARAIEREMDIGAYVKRDDTKIITFADLAKRYEEEVLPTKKGIQQSKSVIKILTEDLGKLSLSAINADVLSAHRDERLKYVKPQTVLHELNMITRIYKAAMLDWGISVPQGNPMALVRKPKVAGARDRRLEDGEWDLLRARLLQCKSPVVLPMVEFALETAARQSEVISLNWADVDLPNRTAKLRGVSGRSTKNNAAFRPIPLSTKAVQILEAIKRPAAKNAPVFNTTKESFSQSWKRALISARTGHLHGLLKVELDKKGIDGESQVRALVFKKREPLPIAVKLLKTVSADNTMLHGFHFHDLRHEAITRLAEKLQMHELMKVTGHKSSAMLERYYHPKMSNLALKLD